MNSLIIKESPTTPEVKFEASKGTFYIAGRSYPENVDDFYQPLIHYLQKYIENSQAKTELSFRWLYYNSATSQIIVKLIMLLKDSCPNFIIKWYCSGDFELMIEKGLELKEVLDVNLEIVK